jgi:hypothetical protein
VRMEPVKFFVAGCACVFGACMAIRYTQAQQFVLSCTPSTTADLQSVESKYCTSNEGDARLPECAPSALRGEPAADRSGFAADHRFDR